MQEQTGVSRPPTLSVQLSGTSPVCESADENQNIETWWSNFILTLLVQNDDDDVTDCDKNVKGDDNNADVQLRFTKHLHGFGNYSYSDWLRTLQLPSLEMPTYWSSLVL